MPSCCCSAVGFWESGSNEKAKPGSVPAGTRAAAAAVKQPIAKPGKQQTPPAAAKAKPAALLGTTNNNKQVVANKIVGQVNHNNNDNKMATNNNKKKVGKDDDGGITNENPTDVFSQWCKRSLESLKVTPTVDGECCHSQYDIVHAKELHFHNFR